MSSKPDEAQIRGVATMWADVLRLQNSRLEDAIDRLQEFVAAQQFLAALDSGDRPAGWERQAREARAVRTLTDQEKAALVADKYLLMLATAQLIKCVGLLPNDGLPQPPSPSIGNHNLMTLLRNLEEHWEDPQGPSATRLRTSISDVQPGRFAFTKDQIWIEGVSVAAVLQWAEEVDRKVREKITGPTPPNVRP